ncbi:MAG: RNA polymerase sigma factor [Clostridiaceae bacterium]|nr:RNA polymerase sigma factor [Clostridiaceae bacterium]
MTKASRLRAGDEDTFAALMEETAPALRRYCAGILLDYDDAEDALQNTYLRFWRKQVLLPEEDKLLSYLYKTAYHACIDLLRSKKLFRPPEPVRPAAEPGFSPELKAALRGLHPMDRALLLERAVEERSYAELSGEYQKSEAALRKRYERAKKRMVLLLEQTKEGVE